MVKVLRDWLHSYFSDEQAVVLAVLLVLGFAMAVSYTHLTLPTKA